MEHNYQKRPGSHLNGPQPKRQVDFSSLTQGVDYLTMSINGETVNVLTEDIQIASSLDTCPFSATTAADFNGPSSSTQSVPVFSPPHTRNGTGYTPVHHPPPSRFAANQANIRQPHVSQQQSHVGQVSQVSQPQIQQIQKQNQQLRQLLTNPLKPAITYSAAASSNQVTSSPSKTSVDPALVAKINRIHSSVFNTTTGLAALTGKVQQLEDGVVKEDNEYKNELKDMRKDIQALQAQNIQVSVEGSVENALNQKLGELVEKDRINNGKISLLGSIVHRQGKQIESLQLSSVITTAMFMANTIYIGGLRQEANENTRGVVMNFLRHRMNLHPPFQEILSAQRLGGVQEKTVKGVKYTFPPPMEVICSPALRYAMWDNKKILKNQRDQDFNWTFYVSLKKPEEMKAWDARYKDAIEAVHKANKEKPAQDEWDTPRIVRGKFTVNGEIVPDPVYPPDVQTMMNLTQAEIDGFDDIPLEVSRDYTLSKSTFRGYCTRATCYRNVDEVYRKLKYEERYATHIMMACLFRDGPHEKSFSCDDGEASGGIEIMNLLQSTKSVGFMVFVIRWKEGRNMGSRRFGCIKAVAKAALDKCKTKLEMLNNAQRNGTPPTAVTTSSCVTTTATTTQSTASKTLASNQFQN